MVVPGFVDHDIGSWLGKRGQNIRGIGYVCSRFDAVQLAAIRSHISAINGSSQCDISCDVENFRQRRQLCDADFAIRVNVNPLRAIDRTGSRGPKAHFSRRRSCAVVAVGLN